MENSIVKGIYRHFKKGDLYETIGIATHSETGEKLVIYKPLYETRKMFARPLAKFAEEVGTENSGQKQPRFMLIVKFSDFTE